MAYGQSILSKVPADWVVTNCELTSSTMALHANGSALLNITIDMIEKLPETAEVTIVAGAYSIYNRVEVVAVLPDNTYVAHTLPIVDVGNGVYKTIIEFPEEPYSSFIFKISSKEGVEITEWSLATPVSADFTDVIDGVKQEIPKLLWDYNTYPFQVGQEEETIGMISAKLFKNVDLQGHLQINCTASEDSTVVVRIFDNEIQELYSPIEFNVKRGRNSVGIPHAYIGRKIGIHNFLITMQVKNGTATVETRGMLYTIDGGYLAQRILDVGYEVHDITIKQLPTDQDPSEIYAVCIDDGKALIRKRVYNEEVAVAWVPEYIIEDAVEACIEFNGLWTLRAGEIGFTLETDDKPYVMWVDSAGILWSQHGPDVTTKFQMAVGVSYMSCCMSYNYTPDIQYDQGLICVYIKSGKVYYKNLCRQNTGTLIWSAERELAIFGAGNTWVSVTRLNDYRCAINAVNSRSQWIVSARGYVGQALRPEQFHLTTKGIKLDPVNYVALRTIEFSASDEAVHLTGISHQNPINVSWDLETPVASAAFTIVDTEWVDTHSVRLICNLPVTLYSGYINNFRARVADRALTVTSVILESSTNLVVTIAETLGSLDALDLLIRGTPAVQYLASPGNRKFVPLTTCSVLSSVLRKREYVALTATRLSLSDITYTAITAPEQQAPGESLTLTMTDTRIQSTNYVQYGESPI